MAGLPAVLRVSPRGARLVVRDDPFTNALTCLEQYWQRYFMAEAA